MKFDLAEFLLVDNTVFFLDDYSERERIDFLTKFAKEGFEAHLPVKSLLIELLMPSKNRTANCYLMGDDLQTLSKVQQSGQSLPNPIGILQLTLWSDGRAEVEKM